MEILEIIDQHASNSNQSWYFTKVVRMQIKGDGDYGLAKERAVRVRIRRNAYDNQSHAVCEVFSNEKWNRVCYKPIGECRSYKTSYTDTYGNNVMESVAWARFEDDATDLFEKANKILKAEL
jgi:hypothetical protein